MTRDIRKLSAEVGALCRSIPGFAGIIVGESFTGGALLSALIADPGASDYVIGGVVFYRPELKRALGLGAPSVSPRFARESARTLRRGPGIGKRPVIAVTTTGYAGPGGREGLFYIGIATAKGESSHRFLIHAAGSDRRRREAIRAAGVEKALTLVLRELSRPAKRTPRPH